jgi:VWFA-related protein
MRLPYMRSRLSALLPLFALLSFAAPAVQAQLAPSPDEAPISHAPPPKPESEEDEPLTTLKVDVNLVNLFFTVKDKDGALIPHLTKENCNVEEDKTPQELKHFQAQNNQPLTLGILLDTSGSQERVLPLEKQFGSQFLSEVLKSKDEAFLVSFDVDVDLLQDYTNSPRQLSRALDKAEINTAAGNGGGVPGIGGGPVPTHGGPKGTLLYDAVYQASTTKLGHETGRKAMIILTDGEDQGSEHKIQEAIEAAQKSNVIVYGILLADRGGYGNFGLGYSGDFSLRKMSDETGGRMINVGNNGKKLEAAFSQIEDELRTQYVAAYTPTNKKIDGTYRKVSVECKADKGDALKVQVRKGYYALAPEE